MKGFIAVIALLISINYLLFAEEKAKFTDAIEDNSYLIEEAVNQEDRVVQHIFNFYFPPKFGDEAGLFFTQEWPLWGQKNQLSYTLTYLSLDKGKITGFGDFMLNYRYQLLSPDDFMVCAPRLSAILPVGNKDKGLGNGTWGFEVNIPISKRWSNYFVNHFNAGTTYLNKVEDKELEFSNSTMNYFLGLSTIYLVSYNINLMLELVHRIEGIPGKDNKAEYENTTIVNPGVRFAVDIGDLQVVPGVSVPIFFNSENENVNSGIFLYLSLEHPF